VAVPACTFRVDGVALDAGAAADLAQPITDDFAGVSDLTIADSNSPNDLLLTDLIALDLRAPTDLITPPDFIALPDLLTPPDLMPIVGMLTGSHAAMPAAIALTSEGTLDWAQWGRTQASDINRKNNVTNVITADFTGAQRFSPYVPAFSWTDGAPTMAETGTHAGLFIHGNGNGFTFTVPASTTARTLRVYVTCFRASAQLVAHLSDSSAADYTDAESAGAANTYVRYNLAYQSASPGQTLTVTWKMTNDTGGGSVDIFAATYF
jgi:hypothetical protein